MKFKTMMLTAAVGVAVSAIAEPARAISLTATSGLFSGVAGTTTVNFDAANPALNFGTYTEAGATYKANQQEGSIRQGTNGSFNRAPAGDTTPYLATRNGTVANPAEITATFGGESLGYFGLYWGSVDSFNSLSFFSGATSLGTFSRAQVAAAFTAAGFGTLPAGTANGSTYVNFFADAGESFDRIVFSSTARAFESDNHAYKVIPTPALLPGLIGMGLAALRKRKGEQEAEA